MDNQDKTIVVREVICFTGIEPNEKHPGKWIAKICWSVDTPDHTYWISEKQKNGIEKVQGKGKVYAAIDATDPSRERFIWASTNSKWLSDTFGSKKNDDLF